jgi:hypothetical protein
MKGKAGEPRISPLSSTRVSQLNVHDFDAGKPYETEQLKSSRILRGMVTRSM